MTACDNIPSLRQAVERARACPDLLNDLDALYDEVDAATTESDVRCMGGGTCCRFDVAGHRLYVSTGELASLLRATRPAGSVPPRRCPYQQGPLCRARGHRPLGCRTFFCQATDTDGLEDLYEQIHRRILDLHKRHDVAYHYVELTAGLDQCSENDDV